MNIFDENRIKKQIEKIKNSPQFVPKPDERIFTKTYVLHDEECTLFYVIRNKKYHFYNAHIKKL